MIDVKKARLVLSRALLAQSVDEHTAIEALNHLGGRIDLEHEVHYCSHALTQKEVEKAFLKGLRKVCSK